MSNSTTVGPPGPPEVADPGSEPPTGLSERFTRRFIRVLRPVWSRRRVGAVIGVAVAGSCGLVLAITMPRGPLTTAQALTAMLLGLLVGAATGLVLRSRWAMLLAPAAFMTVYELGRVGTDGPTVDAIQLSNTYGIIAFVVGRGFTGLLTVLPMLIGAVYGAGLARRLNRSTERAQSGETTHPVWRGTWRVVAAITTVAVIALAVLIARPAGTDPILTADGSPAPNSVAELTQVQIGGQQQTIMIRGVDVDAPVLLFLAGGPGGTEIGTMRLFDA